MYIKSYYQLLIIQYTIDTNRKDYGEKMNNLTADLIAMIVPIMDQIKFYKYSPYSKGSLNSQDPNTAVLDKN